MLGAAFAGAATSVDSAGVGNYQWFSNGAPDFVIVVGDNAADAAAAGNIAAMVGNLAYTSKTIDVLGKDGLSCSGGAGGACSINAATSKVSLEITTPGVNPNVAFAMKTMIEDNLDSNADNYRSTATSFSTGWTTANSTLTSTGTPKVITGGDTPLLKNLAAVTGVRGLNIKETETVQLFAQSTYDQPTTSVQAKNVRAQYKVAFADPLPYCLDTTKNATTANGLCPDADLTQRNRVVVFFLGEQWVVTKMTVNEALKVTELELGKEGAYSPTMNVGDTLTAPNGVKVTLTDITPVGFTTANLARASFKVTNTDGTTSVQTVFEGADVQVGGVVIRPVKIFPGVANTNYAEVELFSDKLDLVDGTQISNHGYWRAAIASTTSSSSPAISEVGVSDLTQGSTALNAGDSLVLITNQGALKLSYNGLEAADYDTLNLQGDTSSNTLTAGEGSVTGKFMTITSARSNAFQFSAQRDTGSNLTSLANEVINTNLVKVLMTPFNATTPAGTVYALGTSSGLWRRVLNGSDMNYSSFTLPGNSTMPSGASGLQYFYKPSESSSIMVSTGVVGSVSNNIAFFVPEIVNDSASTTDAYQGDASSMQWVFRWDTARGGNGQFVMDNASTTIDSAGYLPVSTNANFTQYSDSLAYHKPIFISPRGSKVTSVGSQAIALSYATKVVHAQYMLASGTAGATGNTNTAWYKTGDVALNDGGYKVTVKDINASATGGAAGAAGGVLGLDGLRPSVPKADSVTALSPSTPLVVPASAARSYTKMVVVGGPVANAANPLPATDFTPGSGEVKVVGDKVVVAGYSQADTADAAMGGFTPPPFYFSFNP